MTWQNLNGVAERNRVVAAITTVLELSCIAGRTADTLLACCLFKKIDLLQKGHKLHPTVKHLKTDLSSAYKDASGQAPHQGELCDTQDSSAWFEAWWKLIFEHAKGL